MNTAPADELDDQLVATCGPPGCSFRDNKSQECDKPREPPDNTRVAFPSVARCSETVEGLFHRLLGESYPKLKASVKRRMGLSASKEDIDDVTGEVVKRIAQYGKGALAKPSLSIEEIVRYAQPSIDQCAREHSSSKVTLLDDISIKADGKIVHWEECALVSSIRYGPQSQIVNYVVSKLLYSDFLDMLTGEERQCIELKFGYSIGSPHKPLPHHEIAAATGLSVEQVRRRIARAIKKARSYMADLER